jgi:hypothetical protein
MNSILIQELKNLELFNETMVNQLVSDYIELYTVIIEFDLCIYINGNKVENHKCYPLSLDKFIKFYEKTPNFFKDYSFLYTKMIKNLTIKFYFDNEYLLSTDHFSLIPDILKTLKYYKSTIETNCHPLVNQTEEKRLKELELIEKINTKVNELGQYVVKIENKWFRKLEGEMANTYICLHNNSDYHILFEKLNI